MEQIQDSRFVCKLCNKKYSCGKSLGGHMRSHVVAAANLAESEEKFEFNMKKISSFGEESMLQYDFVNGQSSYGLRENPRKTWRAVDSRIPLPQEKFCKQCGKGFHSLKALCGHMACHSEKDKGLKDDYSWTREKLVMDSHSDTETEETKQIRTRSSSKSKRYNNNGKLVEKSNSFSLANNGSSSVSEIDGQEQEEVAMCLMLLSRDSGNKGCGGVNSVVESSDNNSVVLETKSSSIEMRDSKRESLNNIQETKKIGCKKLKDSDFDAEIDEMENSDSGYFLDECAKADSDVSVDRSRRYASFGESKKNVEIRKNMKIKKASRTEISKFRKENKFVDYEDDDDDVLASNFAGIESRKRKYSCMQNTDSRNETDRMMNKIGSSSNAEVCNNSPKRSQYECLNCKKIFKSYQALGGHRPCHKKSNTFYDSRYESGENSLDDSTEYKTSGKFVEPTSNRKSNAKNSSSSRCNEKKIKPKKKNKGHVCPFCDRVFKNGQALGGHKRSHFIVGHDENNNNNNHNHNNVLKAERSDLLDLNLPAPEAEMMLMVNSFPGNC